MIDRLVVTPGVVSPDADTTCITEAVMLFSSEVSGATFPSSASVPSSEDAVVPGRKMLAAELWVATRIGVKLWPGVRFVILTV